MRKEKHVLVWLLVVFLTSGVVVAAEGEAAPTPEQIAAAEKALAKEAAAARKAAEEAGEVEAAVPGEAAEKEERPKFTYPKYKVQRYAEDYSPLAEFPDAEPRNVFDKIKFIPLNQAADFWMSFGGQVRARYEGFKNFQFAT